MTNVSVNGLWLMIDETEHFLAFSDFPWFREVPIGRLVNVRRPSAGHLYWPELDVDLSIESIRDPAAFPLVGKTSVKKPG